MPANKTILVAPTQRELSLIIDADGGITIALAGTDFESSDYISISKEIAVKLIAALQEAVSAK